MKRSRPFEQSSAFATTCGKRVSQRALHYTELFDGVKLKPEQLRVKPNELAEAHAAVGNDFLEVVRQVRDNVILFQSGLLHSDAVMNTPMRNDIQVRGIAHSSGSGVYRPRAQRHTLRRF